MYSCASDSSRPDEIPRAISIAPFSIALRKYALNSVTGILKISVAINLAFFTVTNPAAGYSAVGSCEWEKNVPAFSIQYEDKNADKPFAVSQTGLYNIQVQLYRLDGSAWNLMDSATSTVMVR